jgi:hypothetical protein
MDPSPSGDPNKERRMTDFLPRLAGGRTDRAKAQAGLTLARQNPGTPVIYFEAAGDNADSQLQRKAAGQVFGLARNHADITAYTRVGTDGLVRGYIVASSPNTPDLTPQVTVTTAPTTSNPATFDLEFFTPQPTETKTSTTKSRRVKRGRPKAGTISASERFYKRLEARRGEWVTLTYIRHTTSGNTLEEDKRRMTNRANSLGNWARNRGLQTPSTRVRVTASGENVTLAARLA